MSDWIDELARRYPVLVHPDPNGQGYVADVPDFPGVCAGGDTPAEALECAYDGIATVIAMQVEDGEPYPAPPEYAAA